MSDHDAQWQEIAGRVEALALKLKLHVEQAGDDGQTGAAVGRLQAAVNDAFEAAGNAITDDAVRADIHDVGRLLGEAFNRTFARLSGDVRGLLERR